MENQNLYQAFKTLISKSTTIPQDDAKKYLELVEKIEKEEEINPDDMINLGQVVEAEILTLEKKALAENDFDTIKQITDLRNFRTKVLKGIMKDEDGVK